MKNIFASLPLQKNKFAILRAMVMGFCVTIVGASASAQEKPAEIGKATEVIKSVDLLSNGVEEKISIGSKIRTEETLFTGLESSAQFEMVDKTTLAIGPDSELVLDKFVFNPDPNLRKVVVTHFKGAMRFLTGKNPSKTYSIQTPTATIGVRGTKFDVHINDDGETIVGLLEGRVNVCRSARQAKRTSQTVECLGLQRPGRFLVVQKKGRLRRYDKLPPALLGDGGFPHAFPFLGGKFRLKGKMAARLNLRNQIRKRAGLALDNGPKRTRKANAPQRRKKIKNQRDKKRANNRRRVQKTIPVRLRSQKIRPQHARPIAPQGKRQPEYERPKKKTRIFPKIPIQIGIGVFPGNKRRPETAYPGTGPTTGGHSGFFTPRIRIDPTIRVAPGKNVKPRARNTTAKRKATNKRRKTKKQRRKEREAFRRQRLNETRH